MSPPGPTWALRGRANFRSREAAPADAAGARAEWLRLARAIEARGGTVVALPSPDAALTGLPYAAECGHALARPGQSPLFLLPRMKGAHRQPEREHWAPLARAMGFEVVDPGAGVWEAQGDVAEFDGCTLLFWGGRTDREGHEAARRHFPGEVLELQIREPAFHGNMALLPLPAVDRLLVCPEVIVPQDYAALERRFGRERLLPVSEEEIRSYATNGLPVGKDWLAPSVVPERVRALVAASGMQVVPLPMVNLCEKGGGASRCLVMVARVDGVQVPEANRLATVARELEA
ncbi:amidinotransferase [Aggregicoccus sp. 17bor-14]|nr:amidinotransferase [Simulacricoccus sp. 17bor-14]MRI92137.1 amidinotransferase [Aggregicoccus sp. 17bor-14]